MFNSDHHCVDKLDPLINNRMSVIHGGAMLSRDDDSR